mmetsp:Transcript_58223/g.153117  ORF Transcript_58223/g.153117 Transcript_58223/m.153117 type:complete len:278 (-) Transcript_58223:6330-7163(-)
MTCSDTIPLTSSGRLWIPKAPHLVVLTLGSPLLVLMFMFSGDTVKAVLYSMICNGSMLRWAPGSQFLTPLVGLHPLQDPLSVLLQLLLDSLFMADRHWEERVFFRRISTLYIRLIYMSSIWNSSYGPIYLLPQLMAQHHPADVARGLRRQLVGWFYSVDAPMHFKAICGCFHLLPQSNGQTKWRPALDCGRRPTFSWMCMIGMFSSSVKILLILRAHLQQHLECGLSCALVCFLASSAWMAQVQNHRNSPGQHLGSLSCFLVQGCRAEVSLAVQAWR